MEKLTKNNFHFFNLVLGAKHWYVPNEDENIVHFFLRLTKLDNQYIVFSEDSELECMKICLLCLDELTNFYRKKGRTMWWDNYITFVTEVAKYKRLYNAKSDAEAIILFVNGLLMMIDGKDIELPIPIYGKGFPRYSNKPGMSYKEMNRIAQKFFNKVKKVA